MAISKEEVLHIAKLSRLKLSESEVDALAHNLSDILQYVEKLNELDVSGVEPMTHAVPTQMRLREDVVEQRLTRDDLMKNAPATQDGMFKVPKVVSD